MHVKTIMMRKQLVKYDGIRTISAVMSQYCDKHQNMN